MATKTKITKEAAESAASDVSAPEKKVAAKAKNVAGVTVEPPSAKTPKPVKTFVTSKPQLPDEDSKPAELLVPESVEKPPGKILPDKDTVAVQEAVQAPGVSTGQKWQEIKAILEKLKEDTLREIRKSVKNGTEAVAAIEPGGDIYDQASSERDRELGLLLGDREREKIHSIDEALLRIVEGDYGICEECDEDIPLGRLKAMPFTRHCVKCKSDLEKLQAQTKRVEEERAYREIPLGVEEEES